MSARRPLISSNNGSLVFPPPSPPPDSPPPIPSADEIKGKVAASNNKVGRNKVTAASPTLIPINPIPNIPNIPAKAIRPGAIITNAVS